MDRADEIAVKLWERTWDWERKEGIADIADELRQYAAEAVAAERKRFAQICDAAMLHGIAAQIRGGK